MSFLDGFSGIQWLGAILFVFMVVNMAAIARYRGYHWWLTNKWVEGTSLKCALISYNIIGVLVIILFIIRLKYFPHTMHSYADIIIVIILLAADYYIPQFFKNIIDDDE